LTNERGEKSAVVHTSILQLVREQVCSFVSMQPFTAYATQTADLTDGSGKVQYLKTQARAGQLFQLRAVFQHRERLDGGGKNSTRSSRISRTARDKDLANRYAQLVSQNNQVRRRFTVIADHYGNWSRQISIIYCITAAFPASDWT
jgi:hypothetical protein